MNPAEPGPMHAYLQPLAGTWQATIKITPAPGAAPLEGSVLLAQNFIFGGRFLQIKGDVEFMGRKGEGLTLIGHDNLRKKYTFYNIASVSTDATYAEGSYDAAARAFTFRGQNFDPASQKPRRFRIVLTLVDDDHFVQENYFEQADGSEFKGVEVTGKRVGQAGK